MNSTASDKIKLCLLITRANVGGAQKHLELLATNLCIDYDIEIVHGGGPYLQKKLAPYPVKLIQIDELNSLKFWVALYKLHHYLKSNRPELLHVHSTLASIYGRLCGRILGIKTVYTVHGWFFINPKNRRLKWLGPLVERLLKKFSDKTIFVSKFDQNLAHKYNCVVADKACFIPNSIDPPDDFLIPQKSPPDTPFSVMFVGRLEWQKDPLLAVEVIRCCPPDTHLTIYGRGPLKPELDKQILKYQLTERVQIVSDIDDLNEHYRLHDCLLVTSRYEGMPLCILEAMAARLPIISTDVCGLSEIIENGTHGYLIDSRAPSVISAKIEQLANNKVLCKLMGENNHKQFSQKFNLQNFVSRTTRVYRELLEN